jgi:hypothetical protein
MPSTDTPQPSDEIGQDRCAHGVLVVHGIGSQEQGATLASFADPLIEFVRRYVTHNYTDEGMCVTAEKAVLSRPDDAQTPAHVFVNFSRPDGDEEKLCIAEGWWAREFYPPSPLKLLRWVWSVGPNVLLSHLARRLRHRWYDARHVERRALRMFSYAKTALYTPYAFALTHIVIVLSTIALLALWLVSATRLPGVGPAAARLATMLATSVGDSFALVSSETNLAAMTNRVRRDLSWLEKRCDIVTVVAHSQGAVVVSETLRLLESGHRVGLICTLGAGLAKLEEMRLDYRSSVPKWLGWTLTLFTAVFILPGAVTVVADLFRSPLRVYPTTIVSFLLVVAMTWFATYLAIAPGAAANEDAVRRRLEALASEAGIKWVDIVASHDPVPAGRLFTCDPEWLTSVLVVNRSSIMHDHTSYFANAEQVMGTIWCELERLRPLAKMDITAEWLRIVGRRRAVRVKLKRFATGALLASVVVATTSNWTTLVEYATAIRLPSLVESGLGQMVGSIQFAWDFLGFHRPIAMPVLLIGAIYFGGRALLDWAWQAWEREDLSHSLERGAREGWGGGSTFCVLASLGMPSIILTLTPMIGSGVHVVVLGQAVLIAMLCTIFPLRGETRVNSKRPNHWPGLEGLRDRWTPRRLAIAGSTFIVTVVIDPFILPAPRLLGLVLPLNVLIIPVNIAAACLLVALATRVAMWMKWDERSAANPQ